MDMNVFNTTTQEDASIPMPEVDENDKFQILKAARNGDVVLLEKLLQEKKPLSQSPFVYPSDWKYTFDHIKLTDADGRTSLHLAASVGNHERALSCVQQLLQSIQVWFGPEGSAEEKTRLLMEYHDKNKETALHLAIENKAPQVVSFLLDYNANTLARNKNGDEALDLIYQFVPDAMKDQFDKCVTLKDDHKSFIIEWGPVIGLRYTGEMPPEQRPLFGETDSQDQSNKNITVKQLGLYSRETNCLRYLLKSDEWGATLLLHPLIKLYLELKWKKVQAYFWAPFIFQIIWLLSYVSIFLNLHLKISDLGGINATQHKIDESVALANGNLNDAECAKGIGLNELWHCVLLLTVLATAREIYQALVLGKAYLTTENFVQIVFIVLFVVQYVMLMSIFPKNIDVLASISAVAIILSTILVIFQLGKTPAFGLQVAAFEKVIYSCLPHLPVFFVWFVGFGLAFWAMFYNADKYWMVGMLAIVAAMGTGELNAEDHLEKFATGSFSLPELIRVFCILLFVIVIVTLYFNLLIGYAVSDIQLLKTKAEMLQLSNRLRTIYTIETFLVSTFGKCVIFLKCKLQNTLGILIKRIANPDSENRYLDSIYVIVPSSFTRCWGAQELKFDSLSAEQLKACKEIAFDNIIKKKQEYSLQLQRQMKQLELSEQEIEKLLETMK